MRIDLIAEADLRARHYLAGIENRPPFPSPAARATDEETTRVRQAVINTDDGWFGTSVWQGRPAFRLSLSSWRTTDADVARLADRLVAVADGLKD